MSLINEALKKAQPQRTDLPLQAVIPAHHHPAPKKRRYLWGFLMAVMIVGLFSSAVTTFLVYQIIGGEDPSSRRAEPAAVQPAAATAQPAATTAPAPGVAEPVNRPASPAAPAEEVAAEPAPVAEAAVPAEVVAAPVQPVAPAEPQPAPAPAAAAAVQQPAGQPNPAVWTRLQELEIRGIMSGGTKVLVFDLSTGKTKGFVQGDVVDGPLALKIVSIKPSAIVFEDYGGFQHNKSF